VSFQVISQGRLDLLKLAAPHLAFKTIELLEIILGRRRSLLGTGLRAVYQG